MKQTEETQAREPLSLRSPALRRLLRLLVALVGAGIGAALTLGIIQLIRLSNREQELPLLALVLSYTGAAFLGGIVFYLISPWVIRGFGAAFSRMVQRLDHMPVAQMVPSIGGLIVGLVIATLLSQMLHLMGASVATTALSAIFYVTFGTLGYTVGWRRSKDLLGLFRHAYSFRAKRIRRKKKKQPSLPEKLLDASALIDGRIAEVRAAGFLEGTLIAPAFVLEELKGIAESADAQKRNRGQRGLDLVQRLRENSRDPLRVEDMERESEADSDVLLLRMARKRGAAIVTCDQTLAKAAAVTGIPVLNLNALSEALRFSVAGGDHLRVVIQKEGREPGQGVAYLEDGTMVVVSEARNLVGQSAEVEVTSVLQTSAGRMVFAKVNH